MRKLICLALLALGLGANAQEYLPAWQEGCFDIHAIATGKGENSLLILPDGTKMLIDAGDMTGTKWNGKAVPNDSRTPGEWVARYIEHFTGTKRLDCFMMTHFHSDHFGNKAAWKEGQNGYALAGITMVGEFIDFDRIVERIGYPFGSKDSDIVANYLKYVDYKTRTAGTKAEKFIIGSHSQLGAQHDPKKWDFDAWNIASGAMITTGKGLKTRNMYAEGVDPRDFDENMFSNVVLFRYGKFSYYHGGDLPGGNWPGSKNKYSRDFESQVADVIGGPVTVAKADHHATRDVMNPYFLWKLRPQAILVHAIESKHYWRDTVLRMLDPLMPGCKNIYPTGEAGRKLLGEDLWPNLKPWGHVVVRVYPGGSSYQIFVLDSLREDYPIIYKTEIIEL